MHYRAANANFLLRGILDKYDEYNKPNTKIEHINELARWNEFFVDNATEIVKAIEHCHHFLLV